MAWRASGREETCPKFPEMPFGRRSPWNHPELRWHPSAVRGTLKGATMRSPQSGRWLLSIALAMCAPEHWPVWSVAFPRFAVALRHCLKGLVYKGPIPLVVAGLRFAVLECVQSRGDLKL